MFIKIRAVNRNVALPAPTGAAPPIGNMIRCKTRIAVATKAQCPIPRCQHFVIDRAVNLVAGCATFAERQMLVNKGASLLLVTLEARLVYIGHRSG